MQRVKHIILTLISFLFAFIIIAFYACIRIVLYCIPQRWWARSRVHNYILYFFYIFTKKATFLDVTTIGAEKIQLVHRPTIFVANHQSALDIPLIGSLIGPTRHIWLAKKELTNNVLLRHALNDTAILIDMKTPARAMRSLVKAITRASNERAHLIIFPEGGRYTDHTIHPFYKGFATIARKTNRPVVPLFIQNVEKAYPPDAWLIKQCPITITVGSHFTIENQETDAAFKERVFEWFIAQQKKS